MHCHNHINTNAVAICPACHKGICQHCIPQDSLVSCNVESCQKRAKMIDDIINNNINIIKKSNRSLILHRFTLIFLGIFFLIMGVLFWQSEELWYGIFFGGFGAVPFFYGIYSLIKKNFLIPES